MQHSARFGLNTIDEMFMYVPLAANTSTTTEGTVGTSIPVSVLNTTAVIGEYAKAKAFAATA